MISENPDASELLRWWHRYQIQRLNQTADVIRNGLLQDLFALGRQWELFGQTCSGVDAQSCDLQVAQLQRVYSQLETLSNGLDFPYLRDSLPLSLQHAVQPWRPKLPLQTEFPADHMPEPIEQTRLLVLLVETLLHQLAIAPVAPCHLHLSLTYQSAAKALAGHADYDSALSSPMTIAIVDPLQPFLDTFRILTRGDYEQITRSHTLTWILRWPIPD